ncbi:MAG: DUF885 domain-containing protein [Flavobacteriaceae bacterium]|nr:DUF885 domain-containing protein [Flavobacteriaceae bacterium]|tara:strand:- start:438 stop:2159 length:1722 start_codon:yes stop_codon:yes gene_type:complete
MKCFFSIIYLSFSISVFSQNLNLKKLESIINEYERFEAFDKEKYPLGDLSEDRFKNEYNFFMQIRSRLSKISLKNLSENEKISYELLVFIIENQINNYNFNTRYNPILSDSGFHNSIIYIVRNLKNKKDAIRYLKLLKAIPLYVDQNIYLIQKGINEGISQPKIIFKGYESSYNKHITVDYNNNYYYTPFLNLPDNISSKIKDSLTKEAQKIINRSVIPSFKKIKSFFEKNYFPFTRNNISISSTPNGIEYYKNRIKFYTTLELTASEIHEIGLKEVKKIRNEMKQIIKSLNYGKDFKSFLNYLRTDKKFYAKTPRELLMIARDISKRLDEKLPEFFKTLPRKPYGVAAVPDAIAPKYTGGRYIPASNKTRSSAYYWVNTYDLKSRPLYTLPALSAHEAVPGHHLQIALNEEGNKNIPVFRKDFYLSAYGEGWGLYAESLADEMGIYTTPYEKFGQLTYSMWRACRLVVDTGIHAFGWSKEKAMDYMSKNTALSFHEINTEIDRYISWPGQALSYKIGELKIKELRSKSEKLLADKFDIHDFHEVILKNGTLTLPLLESQVNKYIYKKLLPLK